MSLTPWKIRSSRYVHPRFRLDDVELPNGNSLEAFVFEFRSWANVLALTKNREAVLIRQYRHGVQDVLWEIPGGVVEDGEDPIDGAKRELLEETGYAASEMVQIGTLYPNPALQTNKLHCFLALNAEKTDMQDLDDAEEIEVHLVSLDELRSMIKDGRFAHALLLAVVYQALAYLERMQ